MCREGQLFFWPKDCARVKQPYFMFSVDPNYSGPIFFPGSSFCIFTFCFSDSFLLSVVKGQQNGLKYIRKDGLDCGEEEVISSCLRNLKENVCDSRKLT